MDRKWEGQPDIFKDSISMFLRITSLFINIIDTQQRFLFCKTDVIKWNIFPDYQRGYKEGMLAMAHARQKKKKNNLEPDEKKSGLEASVLLMNYENLSRCIILSVELCLADRDWQKRDIIISL